MVYELCKQLKKGGIDNVILCFRGKQNTALESKVEKIANVIYLNCQGTVSLGNIRTVIRSMDKIAPDIVHAHMGGALYASIWTLIRNKPLVVTIHTIPANAFSGKVEKILRLRMIFGKFQMVAVSKENQRLADEYYHMRKKCVFVNNGIDLRRFYKVDHNEFTFINVARQDDNKNQYQIIKIVAKLREKFPDIRLFLLGDGPNHNALKAICNEMKICDAVVLPGNVSETERYYANADVYVQTSHREAMPMSILEAMAAGLAVISTDVGGVKDVVKNNGILVPDYDEAALYTAMQSMIVASAEAMRMYSNESIRLVQAYSAEKMSKEYLAIYKGLLRQ